MAVMSDQVDIRGIVVEMGARPGAEMALDVTLWIVEGVRAGNDTSRDAEEGHPTLPSYTIMSGNKSPPSSASPIHGFPQWC